MDIVLTVEDNDRIFAACTYLLALAEAAGGRFAEAMYPALHEIGTVMANATDVAAFSADLDTLDTGSNGLGL